MLFTYTEGGMYQWINCDDDNSDIEGETGLSFSPTVSGNYSLKITLDGCTATSSCTEVVITPNAINELSAGGMSIYPNPVITTLNVETSSVLNQVSIYSINGSLLKIVDDNVLSVDVSELVKGMYILVVQTENGIYQSRFVKD